MNLLEMQVLNLDHRKSIISLEVSQGTYKDMVSRVVELARTRELGYVCFSNVHMVVEAYRDKEFRSMVNKSTFTVPDGKPVALAFRLLHGIRQERIAGMDFMKDILAQCAMHGLKVFLFGSTEKVLRSLRNRMVDEFPNLAVVGQLSPPFREFTSDDNHTFAKEINESGADLVLVSLGCPKQEAWMARNYSNINTLLLGVGGAFTVHAGLTKRAPRWMQKLALEWLFRLLQEPRRLFWRYALTNTIFIWLLIKAKFSWAKK